MTGQVHGGATSLPRRAAANRCTRCTVSVRARSSVLWRRGPPWQKRVYCATNKPPRVMLITNECGDATTVEGIRDGIDTPRPSRMRLCHSVYQFAEVAVKLSIAGAGLSRATPPFLLNRRGAGVLSPFRPRPRL